MNECQGAPWSEELDGKEFNGAAGGYLEPRKYTVYCTSSTQRHQLHKHLRTWYYAVFKGVVFGFIHCTAIVLYCCPLPNCFSPRRQCFRTYGFDMHLISRT